MTDNIERLDTFLKDLDVVMIYAFERRQQIVPTYLQPSLGDVQPIYSERMAALRSEVSQATDEQRDALDRHGLNGPELAVKLVGFDGAYGGFLATRKDDALAPGYGRFRWLKFAKSALKWANIILGSFGGIFGAKDAVEEIKKVVEKGIEDGEDHEFSDDHIIFPR